MKLQLVVCLCSLVTSAVASVRAGPSQYVFFYYAYRIEYESFGASGTKIANGCSVTVGKVTRVCNFDEFLKKIQPPGTPAWTGATGVDLKDATLDLKDASTKLGALDRKQYNFNLLDSTKLMPPSLDPNLKIGLAELLTFATDRVEAAAPTARKDLLEGMDKAIDAILHLRRVDDIEHEYKTLRGYKNRSKNKVGAVDVSKVILITKLVSNPEINNGQDFKVPDYDKILLGVTDPQQRKSLEDFRDNFDVREPGHGSIAEKFREIQPRIKVLQNLCVG